MLKTMITGCDVASYQETWKPRRGHVFAIVKASQGTTYKNPERIRQLRLARAARMIVGHYHFLEAGNLDGQLANFVAAADVRTGDLIAIDWEQKYVKKKAVRSASSAEKDTFLKLLARRYPRHRIGLYCNVDWWRNRDTTGRYGDFLWIAWYNASEPPIRAPWTIWQYSQSNGLDKNRSIFPSQRALRSWANGHARPVVVDRRGKVPFRGGQTCGCVATSLPLVEQDMIKHGVIKHNIDIWQLGYRTDVNASGRTHAGGGSVDVDQYSDDALRIWRKWGWTTQHRTKAQGFDFDHGHGFPYGCTHLSAEAQDQARDWKGGKNGLTQHQDVTGPGWQVLNWKTAIKQLAKGVPVPKADIHTKDELVMADRVEKTRTKGQFLPAPMKGKPHYEWLRLDDKGGVSFILRPGKIIGGIIELTVSGLGANRSLYLFPGAYDVTRNRNGGKDKITKRATDASHPIKIDGAARGWVRTRVPFDWVLGNPADGADYRALRFRVASDGAKSKVERLDVSGWFID